MLSQAHGSAFVGAMGSMFNGWALTQEGQVEEGVAHMRRGLAALLATGAELGRPYWVRLIAEACHRKGDAQEALALLDEAEAAVERTGERYWEAEIDRLRGQLLASASPSDGPGVARSAEEYYIRALAISRAQRARSLELRTTVSLSRLWVADGRQGAARELLSAIDAEFSEGRETSDLRTAALLLAELGGPLRPEPDLTPLGRRLMMNDPNAHVADTFDLAVDHETGSEHRLLRVLRPRPRRRLVTRQRRGKRISVLPWTRLGRQQRWILSGCGLFFEDCHCSGLLFCSGEWARSGAPDLVREGASKTAG